MSCNDLSSSYENCSYNTPKYSLCDIILLLLWSHKLQGPCTAYFPPHEPLFFWTCAQSLPQAFCKWTFLIIFPKIANHIHYQLHVFKFIFLCIAIIVFHHILQIPPSFCLHFISTNRIHFQGDNDHYHFIYSYVPNLQQFLEYNMFLIYI